MTSEPGKPRRSRMRIAEFVNNTDSPIAPEAQIYSSRIKEYRENISKLDWRNEINKVEEVAILEEVETPPPPPIEKKKPKRSQRKKKKEIEVKEVECISDSDDSNPERESKYQPLTKKTLSQAAVRRLDRLKRASKIEIKRLKEEKDRVLANSDFTTFSDNDIECMEEDNSKTSLRIQYMMDVFRIPTRQNEKFSNIIPEIAKHCNINASDMLLCFKDRNIYIDDTPSSLGISLADVIDCCIYKPNAVEDVPVDDKNYLEIKIQANDSKKKTIMYIHRLECMRDVIQKYAKERGIAPEGLLFEFDGEKLTGSETPDDLEMESGSCIDARVLQPL